MLLLKGFISTNWDYILFVLVMSTLLFGLIQYMHHNWTSVRDVRRMWAAVLAIVSTTIVVFVVGFFLVQYAEKREFERTKNTDTCLRII